MGWGFRFERRVWSRVLRWELLVVLFLVFVLAYSGLGVGKGDARGVAWDSMLSVSMAAHGGGEGRVGRGAARVAKRERVVRPVRRDSVGAEAGTGRWQPFVFDPNTLDSAGFVRLGFSGGQARSIVRYRLRGGRFEVKEDFGRLRVVGRRAYGVLSGYIRIRGGGVGRFRPFRFSLNGLDSAGFVRLGFSPGQARTIVRYRRKIGSFGRKGDFLRVYGVDSATFQLLEPYMELGD